MDFIEKMLDAFIGSILDGSGLEADRLMLDNAMLPITNSLFGLFSILGVAFTTAYFVSEFNKKLMFEGSNITFQSLFIPFGKFALALAIITRADEILSGFLGWHNAFLTWCENQLSSVNGYTFNQLNENGFGENLLKGTSFMTKVVMILPCLLLWLVGVIVDFVYAFKALQYKIELLFRVGIAPIALADCYNGMNSQAIKYLKGTIALILYGGCFILVPRLASSLMFAEYANLENQYASGASLDILGTLSILINFIIAPVASLGVLSVCKQVAKEALA